MGIPIEIFCKVIDYFGDAGFAWRLSRLLHSENDARVVLWIDDIACLATFAPGVVTGLDYQVVDGIVVGKWCCADQGLIFESAFQAGLESKFEPQLVLGLFGADPSELSLRRFEAQACPPRWLHIDYLSAEPWADALNGLPSPPPRSTLQRYFLVPGFTFATAGLLREANAETFDSTRWLQRPKAPSDLHKPDLTKLKVSLFCYPEAPVEALLAALAQQPRGGILFVAGGCRRVAPFSAQWEVVHLDWLDQSQYDALLAFCDVNFVRGEESCVRAQLAGRPFIWQAYRQDSIIRQAKLEALLAQFQQQVPASCPVSLRTHLTQAFERWNADTSANMADINAGAAQNTDLTEHLDALFTARTDWQCWASAWQAYLFTLPRLTETILRFQTALSPSSPRG